MFVLKRFLSYLRVNLLEVRVLLVNLEVDLGGRDRYGAGYGDT